MAALCPPSSIESARRGGVVKTAVAIDGVRPLWSDCADRRHQQRFCLSKLDEV